ncbi:MAG: ABC transporter ATP-binding protein, partial [Candidatus Caldarchaeum sp.]
GLIFKRKTASVFAVDDISFSISRGETLGLVGESGSGKTTTGKLLLKLIQPTKGLIVFDGTDITHLPEKLLKDFRKRTGVVFQDPFSSLDPRMRVRDIIAEPLEIHRWGSKNDINLRVKELLELVGLSSADASRYPHQFSGGQRQRIAIARAIALEPDFIVADEPVSALDVSVQAKIVNLFVKIKKEMKVAYLFISHDLAVVRHLADNVAIMYAGKIMEYGSSDEIFNNPRHPYTRALLSVIPVPDPQLMQTRRHVLLRGEPVSPINPAKNCRFSSRCPFAKQRCMEEEPFMDNLNGKHFVSCFYWREVEALDVVE